jgi:AcrR family transcriptional regulator
LFKFWKRYRMRESKAESHQPSRQRLLDAAELLFVVKGYLQVGIRDIAKAAGLSTGAAHYHFTSKRELFLAIVKNRSRRLVHELGARLDEVVARAGARPLTVTEVIGAFTEAAFASQPGDDLGRRLGRLMVHLVIAEGRNEFASSFLEIYGPLYERYLAMLYAALPKGSPEAVEACFHFAQLVLMGVISELHPFLSLLQPGESRLDERGLEERVVHFLAAGFESLTAQTLFAA